MGIEGRRIVVTGGTGGLGRAVVGHLLDARARVHLTYRDETELMEASAYWSEQPIGPISHRCDLRDPAAVETLAQSVQAEGPAFALICLAGTWRGGKPLWETAAEDVTVLLETNVVTTVNAIRAFVPAMVAAGEGRVITVGSRIATRGRKRNAAAAAAKAAVATMTEALAEEFVGTGLAAYCLVPSTIATEANMAAFPTANHSRWVRPEQIATIVSCLLGDATAIANGAVIPVFGEA